CINAAYAACSLSSPPNPMRGGRNVTAAVSVTSLRLNGLFSGRTTRPTSGLPATGNLTRVGSFGFTLTGPLNHVRLNFESPLENNGETYSFTGGTRSTENLPCASVVAFSE